ncbi:MAG: FTR1 family protein [Chloroflexi bacterium]|nr:FTR1 family protein [Chloroflexota bacterium]
MDLGALTSGLLTGLREGVEGALIVSIVLAYLGRTGNAQYASRIWLGVGGALALSVAIGAALFVTIGRLPSPYEQIFEGLTLLIAACVVTWMLFWMRRQAAGVSGELRAAVERVLGRGGAWGLTVLAFTAVVREGIETSLFLVGQVEVASRTTNLGALSVLGGAVVGLAIAVAIGAGFYRGTRRIDLARFFRWTGVALVFIAAGLLSGAVHEFIEIGVIGIGTSPLYDISSVVSDSTGIGGFLHALLGFRSAPELLVVVVHLMYLAAVLGLYLRPMRIARRVEAERGTAGS